MLDQPQIKYKRRPRLQLDVICEALKAEHGLVFAAAKRLEMDAGNLRAYVRTHAKAEAIKQEGRQEMLDLAEGGLYDALVAQERWAIAFTLTMHAQALERGYGVPKNTNVTLGDTTTNNFNIIGEVNIQTVPSGHFVTRDVEDIPAPSQWLAPSTDAELSPNDLANVVRMPKAAKITRREE